MYSTCLNIRYKDWQHPADRSGCIVSPPPLQLSGSRSGRTHPVAHHTHQQRRDQRGAAHQPQRDQKATGEGQGAYSTLVFYWAESHS